MRGGFTAKHRAAVEARFNARIDKSGDCWIWTGPKCRDGYGLSRRPTANGSVFRSMAVHRWMYEQAHGPVPEGLELDHLCRNRACVNPDHLEPVSHRENMLRGRGFGSANAAKTHCVKGHEFTAANTIVRSNGNRACRTCAYAQQREYERRKSERQAA